jgi:hypothetical protein
MQINTAATLEAYARLTIVLVLLKRAETQDSARDAQIRLLCEEIALDILFSQRTPEAAASAVALWISRKGSVTPAQSWEKWFVGKGESKKGKEVPVTLLASLHQLSPFSGDSSPHNLVGRIRRLLNEGDFAERERPKPGPVQRNWQQWGDWALEFVRANGGGQEFFDRVLKGATIDELMDVWPGRKENVTAGARDSFIQRVLALSRDRYCAIILPPVGVLWPIFLLSWIEQQRRATTEHVDAAYAILQKLARQSGDPFGLSELVGDSALTKKRGKRKEPLYVDVLLKPGLLADLPFPFGCADEALKSVAEYKQGEPWEPQWILKVGEYLFHREDGGLWSPPLLLCQRADWSGSVNSNAAEGARRSAGRVRYISLTQPCLEFRSVFRNKHKPLKHDFLLCAQKASWGEPVGASIRPDNWKAVTREEYLRLSDEASSSRQDGLYLGYFPLDLLLRRDFKPLAQDEIFELSFANEESVPASWRKALNYVLPAAALVGGTTLAAQPSMVSLLRDLGQQLWALERLFKTLLPRLDLNTLVDLKDPRVRSTAVEKLARDCSTHAAATLTRECPELPADAHGLLKALLTHIGLEMGKLLCPKSLSSEFNANIREWGWTQLVELVPYTTVDFSGNLLFAKSQL